MKKISILFSLLILATFAGCAGDNPHETVDMANIDDRLQQESVLYIDVREASEMVSEGYIDGFMRISLTEDLIDQEILRQKTTWTFFVSDILDEAALRALFDADRTLYIMCRTGIRSGYIVAVLKHLGYDDVYNIGGIVDYHGDYRVYP